MSDFRDYYGNYNNITKNFDVNVLDNWIDRCLKNKKFSPEMKALIKEIIKRRIEEYDLTPDELKEDMTSLCENLDTIKFAPIKDHPSYLGAFYRKKKKIVINTLAYDKMMNNYGYAYTLKRIYETLTHEVYHAMSVETDKESLNYGNDRFAHYDDFGFGTYQVALMEAIIETAADRTSSDRTKEDFENYKKQTDGYSDLTFIVPVLATAFGVSEREFIKYGLRSREKLILFLDKKVGDVEKTKMLVNKVEFSLGNLHREFYKKRQNTGKQNFDVAREEICNIYSYVAEIMKTRIESKDFLRENASKEIEKIIFENRSLQIMFQNQVNTFSGPIKNQIFSSFNQDKTFSYVIKKIANLSTIDTIIKSKKSTIKPESREYYYLMIKYKKGLLDGKEEELARSLVSNNQNQERLARLLTKGKNSIISKINPELEEKRYKEDYNSSQKWYNAIVINLLKKEYLRGREGIFDKLKRRFRIKPKISLPKPSTRDLNFGQQENQSPMEIREFGSLPTNEKLEYEKRVKSRLSNRQISSQLNTDKSDSIEK